MSCRVEYCVSISTSALCLSGYPDDDYSRPSDEEPPLLLLLLLLRKPQLLKQKRNNPPIISASCSVQQTWSPVHIFYTPIPYRKGGGGGSMSSVLPAPVPESPDQPQYHTTESKYGHT